MIVFCNGVVDKPPRVGDAVSVYGYQDKNSKYKGIQFRITGYEHTAGTDVIQLARFLASFSKFLGDEKAYRIAMHFGEELESVLENTPARLTEVEGIGDTIAQNIADGWRLNRGIRSIKIFLMKLGLPDWRIREVISHHGVGYEEKLKSDPFLLMREGLSFSACDYYAESLGVQHDDPVRYKGFITHFLRTSVVGEGHLYATVQDLLIAFNKFDSDTPNRKFQGDGIVYKDIAEHLQAHIDNGYVVREGDNLYFYDQYFFEAAAAQRLTDMLMTGSAPIFQDVDLPEFIKDYEEGESVRVPEFKLSEQQSEALASFVTDKVLVVTGAPGTGKTTVVKSFVRLMRDYDMKFLLLAPTGIAAKRLEETAGHPAYTIHRKLGYKGATWDHNSRSKLQVDAVLVDEFSMVDQQLLFRLLDALRPDTKLVIVGDVFQLPSVGAGNVLRDLINSKKIKTIFLTKVHRQAETSDIIKAATLIKEGSQDISLFGNDPKGDIVMIPTGNDRELGEKRIVDICTSLKAKGSVRFQVITPRNEGDLSVATLNAALQTALNPKKTDTETEIHLDKDKRLRVGDRVMVTKNHYGLGVYNGDVGKVLVIAPDVVQIRFEGLENVVSVPTREAPQLLRLAYSTTVHRCQGMEYQVVVLALIRSHGHNLLQRNLLYTAVTRAKKKVIVVGQTSAILQAIENESIRHRNTHLASRIRMNVDKYGDPSYAPLAPLLELKDTAENYTVVRKLLFPSLKVEADEPGSFIIE
jgi:exodeoxyribonuclease V alpha subunit